MEHRFKLLKYYQCCLLCMTFVVGLGQSPTTSWLEKLTISINQAADYDADKLRRIDSLHKIGTGNNKKDAYDFYAKLYGEYALFNFDSAYFYANQMHSVATETGDDLLRRNALINLSFVLLSSGMFKELFDSLSRINIDGLAPELKAEYYVLKARSLFDLSEYNQNNGHPNAYNEKASQFLDSAILFFPEGSFNSAYYQGLKKLRAGEVFQAVTHFQKLLRDTTLTLHHQAIINSTYSDIYIRRGMQDSAIILLTKAAIADIQSSTRETLALFNLATLLFKQGDLDHAAVFIQKAVNDARVYGARQRMMQLSNVLPMIEAERLALLQQQKSNVTRYAIIVTILFAILVILIFVIIRQVKRLKGQQKEINQKNVSLYHLVEEKEWLLKEIHHRVKNNLHTITSLLESQSAYLENDALAAIKDSQHRVFAMSLIHQKLYQPEKNVTSIDMQVYIHELVNYLKDSFETTRRIQFKLDLEPGYLDISLAVPLGLILNEAITNSVKYGFPGSREGFIQISIKQTAQNTLSFVVRDNGVGLPPGFEISKSHSLGMKLMQGLSEDIAASFSVTGNAGTSICVEMSLDKSMNHLQNTLAHRLRS